MKHLRDTTLDDLRAVAGDAGALNLLCHQMLRRPETIDTQDTCDVCLGMGYVRIADPIDCGRCSGRGNVPATIRASVERFCRPDVPLDRLMELVEGARQWTGEDTKSWPTVDVCDGIGNIYIGLRDPGRRGTEQDLLYEFGQWPTGTPLEVAIILACLAAVIVYGEKRV